MTSRYRFLVCAGIAMAVIMLPGACGPALGWQYTSASPLVFEFGDNDNSVFDGPTSGAYLTYANAPHNTVRFGDVQLTGIRSAARPAAFQYAAMPVWEVAV